MLNAETQTSGNVGIPASTSNPCGAVARRRSSGRQAALQGTGWQIIGQSEEIERTIREVKLVAPTAANVMIFGESGTGKELIAKAIHELGDRRNKPLVRVNCGAIPHHLFESEFFGHVKGSFTGAVRDRAGRFELADGGTLFLDEVGEIPLDQQVKLLRVLQEGEFERVGEGRTRRVDVRVIAATNRDLKAEVEAGRFRQDLYFRLNVIPVHVPALRERLEDLPSLADHFIDQARQRSKHPIGPLEDSAVVELQRYAWPGNIRELQNAIERACVFSNGDPLQFDLPPTDALAAASHPAEAPVLFEASRKKRDRDAIIAALRLTGGKVAGRGGAAAMLGVKPTTLASRIKALGITKAPILPMTSILEAV